MAESLHLWSLAIFVVILNVVVNCEGWTRHEDMYNVQQHFNAPPHIHGKFIYVTWTADKGYDIKIFGVAASHQNPSNLDWVAKGRFQNLVNKTGWASLEIETKATWPDDMQTYAAGIAEGYLTRDLIFYFWQNVIEHYCDDDKQTVCKYVKKFAAQNDAWVQKSISQLKDKSPYWHHVHLIYQQLEGIRFGYRKVPSSGDSSWDLQDYDFAMLNMLGDLSDLESALDPSPKKRLVDMMKEGHCSALIKLVDNRDLYSGHVTWWRYTSMLRIIKRYEFPLKTSSGKDGVTVPGVSISMSSYPGLVFSMDDYYTTSSGLLVTETSFSNFNQDLWKKVTPENSLYTSIRAMVANRLASDGRQWTKLFTLFNSGTYNNQWIIVNYNLYEPQKPLKEGLLWVLEQLPGLVVSKDVTSVLSKNGYWASYNTPFFNDVFELSGSSKMQAKFGDYFSYDKSPRSKIFARDQKNVHDVESMMKLMRYNDYQNDPLSKCNCTPPYSAINAISARCDLNPQSGTYPFPALGFRPNGATDMKVTNLDLFVLQQFIAIGGPTHDPLPPFQWSKSPLSKLPHFGQPDKWEFEPLIHHWHWL